MNTFGKELSDRIEYLTNIIHEKISALQHAPDGALRIIMNGKYPQYYFRQSAKDKNGRYLSVKETVQIQALAQKGYDRKVLKAAQREQALLLDLQRELSFPCAEDLYSLLHKQKQKLVSPIEIPDDTFIQQWQCQSYIPKPFEDSFPEHYTRKGERVRSKSEVLIANTLTDLGIPYLYEKPLYLEHTMLHPDFTILHIKTREILFLEHLGMLDDPEYAETTVSKLHLYIRYGILPGKHLFMTFETRRSPLNIRILKSQLEILRS